MPQQTGAETSGRRRRRRPAPTHGWTLVAHSGLPRAVEEAVLTTAAEVAVVRAVGGLVFATYAEASEAAYDANYPVHVTGICPRADGTFGRARVGGQRVYLPPAAVR